MKVLFQGGFKDQRQSGKAPDPPEAKARVEAYCKELARSVVHSQHELILSSPRHYDLFIAKAAQQEAQKAGRDLKEVLTFLLPERIQDIPEYGRVRRFSAPHSWMSERTYLVRSVDALVAIGGGRGTEDCIDKAFFAGKPVFVACGVSDRAAKMWTRRPPDYRYLEPGDCDFVGDLNTTPEEFFEQVFAVLDRKAANRAASYPRRVFIVHGRDHGPMRTLKEILEKLGFEAIVFQDQPDDGRTIIEKLENEVEAVGFGFILYTPDDCGGLRSEEGRLEPRARQNVVFEHGLLMGKLDRKRVCALLVGRLERPSDIDGLLCKEIRDLHADRYEIGRVLREAGYRVDLNRLP